jgi:hypothetical protein
MKDNQVTPEAQNLDQIFNHHQKISGALDPREAELARQICRAADAGVPVDEKFYQKLREDLLKRANQRERRPRVWPRILFSFAGAAALIALVLLSAPLLQHLLGKPLPQVSATPMARTAAASDTPASSATPKPAASATPLIQPTQSLPLLKAALPDGPEAVPAYIQTAPGELLTPQNALEMAERLGVKGVLYQYTGEGGNPTYTVSDGASSVLFFGATNAEFTYFSTYAEENDSAEMPFAEQSRIAEEWLKSRGLLDFPYRIEPVLTNTSAVSFVPLLESGSLFIDNQYDPPIHVTLTRAGQVTQVIYRPLHFKTTATASIRPAEQAWADILAAKPGSQVFFQTLDFSSQRSLQTWTRPLKRGERADLYGYASVLQPVDPIQPPHVEISNISLRGGSELIRQIPMRQALHIWGIYQVDDQGHHWLDLQSWEVSTAEEVNLSGVIFRDDSAASLKTDQDDLYRLPDLPPSVPAGLKVTVNGFLVTPGEVLWQFVQTNVPMDENLTFGAFPFIDLPPETAQAIPTPQTGYQPGDRVEGIQGTYKATIYKEQDGSQNLKQYLIVPDWSALLEGPALEGIQEYQNMPVKVWGTYATKGEEIILTVDRYEPVWPNVHITAWFGKVSERLVEGKNVFILTDDQDQDWVLENTILYPMSLTDMGWDPGTELVVEGYPSPEVATFGGLPVLHELSTGLVTQDRQAYQTQLNQPEEIVVPPAPPDHIPAGAIVEQVELAYYGQHFQGAMLPDDASGKMQPIWRFTGHMQDGRVFEILVPAWIKGEQVPENQ